MDTTNAIGSALETGRHISEFGMLAVTAGFFLVLTAIMWVFLFKWFMKIINNTFDSQKSTLTELLEEAKSQNEQLASISEGLMPETLLRVKTVTSIAFDLSIEKVCRLIKKVREENHIKDRETTAKKIRRMLQNIHDDRNSKFDAFFFRGKKLSVYTSPKWVEKVANVVEGEIYNPNGENNGRTYTNVEAIYSAMKIEMYQNMTSMY